MGWFPIPIAFDNGAVGNQRWCLNQEGSGTNVGETSGNEADMGSLARYRSLSRSNELGRPERRDAIKHPPWQPAQQGRANYVGRFLPLVRLAHRGRGRR